MKVLILGNSNDTGNFVPEEAKRHRHLRDMLAAEFGDPVEIVIRHVWPNDRMVDWVLAGVDQAEPDMVYVNITQYPFAYESTPMRVRRVFKRVGGEGFGDAGLRMAGSKRWSHNAVFRAVRRAAQAPGAAIRTSGPRRLQSATKRSSGHCCAARACWWW